MAGIRGGRLRWRYAAALAAGFVLVAAAPASAAGPWRLEAGRTRDGLTLSAVSCTSTGWCAAVGYESDETQGLASKPYAESGDGSVWTVAPTSGPKSSELTSVSCIASDWCQAVGNNVDRPNSLIERWNGRAWSPVSSPVAHGDLTGVSCTSRQFCIAVGSALKSTGPALVERWNGTKWSVVPSPLMGLGTGLTSVACVSPTWCVAVGFYAYNTSRSRGAAALVEEWNGKAWKIAPSPHPGSYPPVILYAVDCVSPTWCMAGGQAETGALIEHWNGRAWTIMGHPSGVTGKAIGAAVWGISCVSQTACVAVGYNVPLAESWNGTVWSRMSAVDGWDAQGAPPQYFSGVSCITASLCKTVGDGNAIATSG